MAELQLTVVGGGFEELVENIFAVNSINPVNKINGVNLGNFRTLIYLIDIPEESVIETRRKLMKALSKERNHLIPMYEHGNWMKIYIFKQFNLTPKPQMKHAY